MLGRLDRDDRRAAVVGLLALVVITVSYPLLADAAARPLAVFVLPSLLTAVLGGWRPTVVIGGLSLAVSIVVGLEGPLEPGALIARWMVIALGAVMGAVGAAVRERQSGQLADLDETVSLRAAFERALAPSPVTPAGFVAVSRYRAAESKMQLGGDFLDAVALPDGRLAVIIGDVCGHGPREAAFGAALRAGWKSLAITGPSDPSEWVNALNESFFKDGRVDTYVTLCTGYLDRCAGIGRFVNAGHPPPLALDRPTRLLDLPASPPLGLGLDADWRAHQVEWNAGTLLFYTDGLIEHASLHGPAERWGVDGLVSWLDQHMSTAALERVADNLIEAATTGRDARDDIALLLVSGRR